MTSLKITETDTVQFPIVCHAAEVGWTPLPPRDALAMRGGAGRLLFRGVLEGDLHRFNPGMMENEHYNAIGNSVQRTTDRMLVWRKADNWTACSSDC